MFDPIVLEQRGVDVQRFKALGDPTRLRILHVLAEGTRCACEVQERVDVAANLLSHHLKVLREAGLIQGQRRGRWIDYQLDREGLAAVPAALPDTGLEPSGGACACGRSEARPSEARSSEVRPSEVRPSEVRPSEARSSEVRP